MEGTSSSRSNTTTNEQFPEERSTSTHFHYKKVMLSSIRLELLYPIHKLKTYKYFIIQITNAKNENWSIHRNWTNLITLDQMLHKCHFKRAQSELPRIDGFEKPKLNNLQEYIKQLSKLITNAISCSLVLSWFKLDNYGRELKPFYDPNEIPEIAKGRIVRSYYDPDTRHICPNVGDIVNILDVVLFENKEWWMAQYNRTVVLFPRNFIQVTNFGSLRTSCLSLMSGLSSSIADLTISNREGNRHLSVIATDSMMVSFSNLFRKLVVKLMNCHRIGTELMSPNLCVFGTDLTHYLSTQTHQVPKILKCCSDFIEYFGLIDGIYRLSGQQSNIQKLREIFNEDNIPNLYEPAYKRDVHSIASILKMYFRELPNPVCTYELYSSFTTIVRNFNSSHKHKYRNILLELQRTVTRLPPAHFRTLSYLCHHLRKMSLNVQQTRMNSKALAIVWAPNLLRQEHIERTEALNNNTCEILVTEFFIKFPQIIFALPDDDDDDATNASSPSTRNLQ